MIEQTEGITRAGLARFVKKRIKSNIKYSHVLAVINILFDEIIKDFSNDKPLKIFNFGKLKIKRSHDRWYIHIINKKRLFAKGKRKLYFILIPRVKKAMLNLLDYDKMLKED